MEIHIEAKGAVSDGETLNTKVIQEAINECHAAGGGRVVVGAGRFRTGSLDLKSGVELHLESGAVLLGSPRLEDYPKLEVSGFRPAGAPEQTTEALIRAIHAEGVSITGSGMIDGEGQAFYDREPPDGKWEKPGRPRPRLVMFYGCKDFRIEGVQLVDAAMWTIWLMQCAFGQVRGITIRGDRRMRNVDGIDIDACRMVTVSDCLMDTEDDCVVLRSIQNLYEEPAICEGITVTNCTLKTACQGVRVGVPSDGVIRDCTFSNLVIQSTHNGILFQYPHRYLRKETESRADVSRIVFSNCVIRCDRWPIRIIVEEGIELKRLSHLSFSHFQVESGEAIVVQGSPETTIREVRFSDIEITTRGEVPIEARRVRGLQLDDVRLSGVGKG